MDVSEKRDVRINGNLYYVVAKETNQRKRVTIYNKDKYGRFHPRGFNSNYIVSDCRRKGRFWYFGKDTTPELDKMIQDTLNEAVCIRENKEESVDEFEERVNEAISNVEEVHGNV
jgi:hypothetical protein